MKDKSKNIFSKGIILPFLSKIADGISDFTAHSLIGGAFLSYYEAEAYAERSLASGLFHTSGKGKVRLFIARQFDNSKILTLINRFFRCLLTTSMRVYSAFFMTFAVVSALGSFISIYTKGQPLNKLSIAISAGLFVLSLLLLFSKRHLYEEISSSRILKIFLYKMLGVRREKIDVPAEKETRVFTGLIYGLIFGILSYFLSTVNVVLVLAAIIVAYILFVMPEIGVVGIFFAVPFLGFLPHPSMLVLGAVLFISFATFLIRW